MQELLELIQWVVCVCVGGGGRRQSLTCSDSLAVGHACWHVHTAVLGPCKYYCSCLWLWWWCGCGCVLEQYSRMCVGLWRLGLLYSRCAV